MIYSKFSRRLQSWRAVAGWHGRKLMPKIFDTPTQPFARVARLEFGASIATGYIAASLNCAAVIVADTVVILH